MLRNKADFDECDEGNGMANENDDDDKDALEAWDAWAPTGMFPTLGTCSLISTCSLEAQSKDRGREPLKHGVTPQNVL